ncbi:MAG: hypothetical protein GC190_20745 [Alphaproteobacteria bacterium]|nr:hypothetical protein [Alphaproteobacteria bacterium]
MKNASPLRTLALRVAGIAAALALTFASPAQAHNHAHPVSIEGNWVVALVIVLVALWGLVLLVRGVLFIDERDAWLRRGAGNGNDYWIRD